MNYALWAIQGLLALLFLFAGGTKLVLPLDQAYGANTPAGPIRALHRRGRGAWRARPHPPRLLHKRPELTLLAAAGLVIIMIGATVLTLAVGDVAMALIPLVVGLLSAFVAYGRWRLAPHRGPTGSEGSRDHP